MAKKDPRYLVRDRPIEFEIRGIAEVTGALAKIAEDFPDKIDYAISRATGNIRDALKREPYPEELPNQVYVRTGNLASSWRALRKGKMKYGIGNRMHYAAQVVGNEYGKAQMKIHRGRWWKVIDVVERELDTEMDEIAQILYDSIDGAF